MKKYRSGSMPELHSLTTIKKEAQKSTERFNTLIQRQTLMKNVLTYKLEKENKELRINLKELNAKLNSLIGLRKPKFTKREEKKLKNKTDQFKCYEKELDYYK